MIETASFRGIVRIAEFGAAASEVVTRIGEPTVRDMQRSSGLTELRYSRKFLILRFDLGGLREVTLTRFCDASLNGVTVSWDRTFLFGVFNQDPGLLDTGHGFLYSPNLGVMLTGFHDDDLPGMALHLLPAGAWDAYGFESKPFTLEAPSLQWPDDSP